MTNRPGVFKILGITILSLVIILIVTNLLYIKAGCLTGHCILINVMTIVLLVWATAFWLMVITHSHKK